HHHPLTFIEELEDDGVNCNGCGESISGPCCRCGPCKYFLHKSCVELPLEIVQHPLHPHHILHYHYKCGPLPCFSCKRVIEGFLYSCTVCYFILDVYCSHTSLLKLQQRIQHRTHNPSIYVSKPAIFSCDACGVEHKGKFYLCTTCDIMVNKTCHASTKSFKHNDHEHDLVLADCLPSEDFKFLYRCEICRETLSREYWTYYCKKCLYFVHLKCAKSKTKLSSGQRNYERVAKFNHPSHMRPLILSDDQSKAPCNGCALPILGSFYHCAKTECRFLLHECSCSYEIDCKCASSQGIIKHEAHKHALVWQEVEYRKYCNLCAGSRRHVFACDSCSFYVCSDCAMLCRVMRHRYDEHPFRLTYSPSYLDADEFYCEICEEEIDPKIRFYHCDVCDQSTHPECISPRLRHPNWKFRNFP
ncbi:hypothetical protein NMG60_11008436, partial [Bertholletia excelsa]